MNYGKDILGEFANQGFSLEEVGQTPNGTIFEIYFKDAPTGIRFSELWATEDGIRNACRQYLLRLNNVVGAV